MKKAAAKKPKTEKPAPPASRMVRVSMVSVADLVDDPKQARDHTPRGVGSIVDSMKKNGVGRGGLVDEGLRILAGNATKEALIEAGFEDVLVVPTNGKTWVVVQRPDLTEQQKIDLAIADNRAAEHSSWNAPTLVALQRDGFDFTAHFSAQEFAAIEARAGNPGYEPTSAAGQGGLGTAKLITCPSCGHEFEKP